MTLLDSFIPNGVALPRLRHFRLIMQMHGKDIMQDVYRLLQKMPNLETLTFPFSADIPDVKRLCASLSCLPHPPKVRTGFDANKIAAVEHLDIEPTTQFS